MSFVRGIRGRRVGGPQHIRSAGLHPSATPSTPLPSCHASYHTSTVLPIRVVDTEKNNRVPNYKTPNQKRDELEQLRNNNKQRNIIAKESGFVHDWTLKCAVVVERPQVLTPLPEPWLAEYDAWRQKWDSKILCQYPLLSILDEDVEVIKQKEQEAKQKEKEREKTLATETEEEKQERLEREKREARMAKLRAAHVKVLEVKVGSRFTEADRKNDTKSVYRKLDEKLYLIVKKNRSNHSWQFPQGPWKSDETLRQTAERVLKYGCNKSLKFDTHFVGHGPISFYAHPYLPDIQKKLNTYGSKVFFYYAYYLNGDVSLDTLKLVDYAWVTKEEMPNYLNAEYFTELKKVLPDSGKHELLTRDMPTHYLEIYTAANKQKQKEQQQQQTN